MRATLAVLVVTSLLFAISSIVPRQQEALHGKRAVQLPVDVAAHRIANYADENLPPCFRTLHGQFVELTKAIIAVEYVSVSQIEHVMEYGIAQTSQLTGMPLPDLSYGVAQVRPSTVAKLRSKSVNVFPEARDFVNECTSIAIGHEVIVSLMKKYRYVTSPQARLLIVIREYTGQLHHRPEHTVHNAIVLQLYMKYKDPKTIDDTHTLLNMMEEHNKLKETNQKPAGGFLIAHFKR